MRNQKNDPGNGTVTTGSLRKAAPATPVCVCVTVR